MPSDDVSERYRVDQIKEILHKQVSVIISEQKETATGILVAADPISHSCVLLTGEVNKEDPFKSQFLVIPEVDWEQVTVLPDQPSSSLLQPTIAKLTADPSCDHQQLTPELTDKLARLQKFVLARNLTAVIQGSSLRVQNCVSVHPPFSSADCRATNEIVLDRVANLINQFNTQE
jgi:hypothetical protein